MHFFSFHPPAGTFPAPLEAALEGLGATGAEGNAEGAAERRENCPLSQMAYMLALDTITNSVSGTRIKGLETALFKISP